MLPTDHPSWKTVPLLKIAEAAVIDWAKSFVALMDIVIMLVTQAVYHMSMQSFAVILQQKITKTVVKEQMV